MKILGIDTSSKFLCLGVYDQGRVYEYNLEVGRKLSSLLVKTIKRVLEILGWEAGDIDYFACGLGPGSFTGMRIGLATIKALAWSLNKSVVGISTLDILARNAKVNQGCVTTVVDAKRSLIYCCNYEVKNKRIKRKSPYMLLNEKELLAKIKKNSVILGDALVLYKDNILKETTGAAILDKDYWYPKAHNLIALALEKIREKKLNNTFEIKPIYLYPKECQIKSV